MTINQASQEGFFDAICKGDVEQVERYIAHGAAVDKTDRFGSTALQSAAQEGHVEVVRLLLDRGAQVNGWDGGMALQFAALKGYFEVVRLLLDRGVDVNWQDYEGFDVLSAAALSGNLDVVRLLLDRGADVNWGSSLYMATSKGHVAVVRLLVLYGAFSAVVPDAPETRAFRKLGDCLRAAPSELEAYGCISASTCAQWENVHTGNPELYLELARLSPRLHSEAQMHFGARPDWYYWKQPASLPAYELPELKLPVIRRVAMDYLKAQGHTFSSGKALSAAINNSLTDHVRRVQGGSWELGELAPYWEKYKTEPDAHLGTLVQLWGLLSREHRALNDYRGERLSVFLGKVQQLKQEYAQDWVMASCALPGQWCPDTLTVYEQTLMSGLKRCQHVTEFARAVIFNQEFSWDALQAEIEALNAFPEYPLQEDLRYFFSVFLQGMWELDNGCFEALNSGRKAMLRELAQYAECPQLQSPLWESKPEDPDEVRGFDAEVAQAADASIPSCDAYWPALRQALRDATSPKSGTLTASTFVYRAMAPQAAAEAKEERGCQPAAKKARHS